MRLGSCPTRQCHCHDVRGHHGSGGPERSVRVTGATAGNLAVTSDTARRAYRGSTDLTDRLAGRSRRRLSSEGARGSACGRDESKGMESSKPTGPAGNRSSSGGEIQTGAVENSERLANQTLVESLWKRSLAMDRSVGYGSSFC